MHIPIIRTIAEDIQGSGKTTLLQHILRSEHGLRIAVIVNDIGAYVIWSSGYGVGECS
jgi:G3E family GTPase